MKYSIELHYLSYTDGTKWTRQRFLKKCAPVISDFYGVSVAKMFLWDVELSFFESKRRGES